MSDAKFVIGMDLGTSNCAVACAEIAPGVGAPVVDFPIPQARRPGEVAAQPLFPSCLYLAGEHELALRSVELPWEAPPGIVAGEFARWQGAQIPGRLIASAKSWLCHSGVDRAAPILPWGAPADLTKLSPVDASAALVRHLIQAWNFAHRDHPLPEQDVVITVPASFDEVARALTVSAARRAGLERFTLVEEPQAAFYDFTARHRRDLGRALRDVRLVLVMDVGGGTSDFTLVQVGVTPEGPALKRIAVGEHLMLGGENMDAALARRAEEQMVAGGRKLSATQWTQLVQTARLAKESLLGAESPEVYHLSIVAGGSRLIGGALSARLTREDAEQTVLDGFFPRTEPDDEPRRTARGAIQELGLPYARDPAVTRHLAAFLRQHARVGFEALGEPVPDNPLAFPRPDAILLNGGVFNASRIAARLIEAVSSWWPAQPPIRLLEHESLDLAVARGAAYYGLVRRGLGRRIGGGAAHAFYIGLESGDKQPQALCVLPRGQEEGETIELTERKFRLTLGRPVQFAIYSTASDRLDRAGDVVPVTEDLQPLRPLHTLLKSGGGQTGETPVHLRSTLTEIGTLELSCVSEISNERWRLEFELRGTGGEEGLVVTESMPSRFGEARQWIDLIYGSKPAAQSARRAAETASGLSASPPRDVKQLWASLERTLGPREDWRLPVLRELWGTLQAGVARRRRSAAHERIYFQLGGYTLRPGFGYPLDEWRCEQTFPLFRDLVQHHKEQPVWNEFWVMWRRIGGGLSEAHQVEIWTWLKPHLLMRLGPKQAKQGAKAKGIQPQGLEEMVRAAASLEHLPPEQKAELGSWVTAKLRQPEARGGPWAWALGRLGARVPLYGSVHKAVPPEQAAQWITAILEPGAENVAGGTFALAQLARLSGDRARDIDDSVRLRAVHALETAGAPVAWRRMVTEIIEMEAADEARALGDTLPSGLRMVRD